MGFIFHLFQCRLADLVGFGVAIATGTQFIENFPERTYKSMIIPIMQEDKRAGRNLAVELWELAIYH